MVGENGSRNGPATGDAEQELGSLESCQHSHSSTGGTGPSPGNVGPHVLLEHSVHNNNLLHVCGGGGGGGGGEEGSESEERRAVVNTFRPYEGKMRD